MSDRSGGGGGGGGGGEPESLPINEPEDWKAIPYLNTRGHAGTPYDLRRFTLLLESVCSYFNFSLMEGMYRVDSVSSFQAIRLTWRRRNV